MAIPPNEQFWMGRNLEYPFLVKPILRSKMSAPVLAEMLEKMRVRRLRAFLYIFLGGFGVPLVREDQTDLTFEPQEMRISQTKK